MFFKAKTDKESLKDQGAGGSFIGKSDIYDVTLKTVSVVTNEHNARALNFNVDYNGNESVLYGLKLDNNDGTENYQAALLSKLMVITGIEELDEPTVETHNIGKDKTPTDLAVITELSDMEVKIKVQNVYSKYNGEIKERKEIRGFYRMEDGATAAELINDVEPKQYAKDLETVKDILKDGVTEEDVAAFIASRSGNSGAPKTTAPAGAPVKKNPFAKKA